MRLIFRGVAAILCLLMSESVFAAHQMTPRQAFYYHAHRGDLSSIQKLKQKHLPTTVGFPFVI